MRRKRRPNIILTNRSVLPYNIDNDTLKFKLIYRNDQQQNYTPDMSGYVYGNIGISGTTVNMGPFSTNKFGLFEVLYDTDLIPDRSINTAKFWASGWRDDWALPINSCIARADFLFIEPSSGIIITAGSCGNFSDLGTRYGFDEFDADRPFPSGFDYDGYIETVTTGVYPNFHWHFSNNSLYMSGSMIVQFNHTYDVTSETILSFDYRSTEESGVVQGVGFEVEGNKIFDVYGAGDTIGSSPVVQDYRYTSDEWQHFRIPVGQYFTGAETELYLFNANTTVGGTSWIKNITIAESGVVYSTNVNDIIVIERPW